MMKIGYIQDYGLNAKDGIRFKLRESSYTRRISSRSDRVYAKILSFPVDYEEVAENAKFMQDNPKLIIVREPFLIDDELRERVSKWIACANKQSPEAYDPFWDGKRKEGDHD